VAIAFDDKSDFFIDGETGKVVSDHVRVARARLQVDALKWASAKLLPKVYGDRGDRHEQDDKPQAITIQWQATDAPAPPVERPPRQIPYRQPELPGDLTPADWQKLLAILEVVTRPRPRCSRSCAPRFSVTSRTNSPIPKTL
jgi:terminase small subunit-like protein